MNHLIKIVLLVLLAAAITGCDKNTSNNESGNKKAPEDSKEQLKLKTIENTQTAYGNEKEAQLKYLKYSDKAKQDGYPRLAFLFNVISEVEAIHSEKLRNALSALGVNAIEPNPEYKIRSSVENINDALKSNLDKITEQYKDFNATSKAANISEAFLPLNYALQTEKVYKNYFREALKSIQTGTDSKIPDTYYICPNCGNIFIPSNVPEHCQISLTTKNNFEIKKLK